MESVQILAGYGCG